jgi:enoyl-CoA hydratase/carnithine racemase
VPAGAGCYWCRIMTGRDAATTSGLRITRAAVGPGAPGGVLETWYLDKARGNALDEALIEALLAAVAGAAGDPAVRGVLLASAHPKLFCPGLDLVALAAYDRPAMTRYLEKFARLIVTLYALEKPVVAALSGHAVAGGCILSLCADWRVLRRGGVQVGLNEVRVGVPMPWPVAVLLRASVSPRLLARVGLLGRNFADDEAVAVGLADEVAPAEGFAAACRERLVEFADKEPVALNLTKRYLRAPTVAAMVQRDGDAAAEFLDAWFSPTTQARIQGVVASLTRA